MSDKKLFGFGNVASAAGGIAASLINNHAARKENERNREYNLKLAQMQNQWNVEQWQRENDYNTPMAQIQRLKEAGINPDMVYGGGIANTSTSSPQMTAGAPSSPTPLVGMPNAVDSYLDSQLKQAQIDNINADTQKKGAEASIFASDAKFRDEWNRGLIKGQYMDIQVAESARDLNNQDAQESMMRCKQIEAVMSQINATVAEIYNRIDLDNAKFQLDKALNSAQVKELISRKNLNDETVNRMRQELENILRHYDDEHDYKVQLIENLKSDKGYTDENKAYISTQNKTLKFKYNVVSNYKGFLSAEQKLTLNDELFKAILQGL